MINRPRPKKVAGKNKKESLQGMLRRVYERFVRIRGQPREIALGFALGIFIGMLPIMGVQIRGVLSVELKKAEESRAKKIAVY